MAKCDYWNLNCISLQYFTIRLFSKYTRSSVCSASDSRARGPRFDNRCRPHTFASPSADSRKAVVSYWRKYVHEVLVNRLRDLSLPRKSVVRLTDRPGMTINVFWGRNTTATHNNSKYTKNVNLLYIKVFKIYTFFIVIILFYQVVSNGFIAFDGTYRDCCGSGFPYGNIKIAPLWDDLYPGTIYYRQTTTDPADLLVSHLFMSVLFLNTFILT